MRKGFAAILILGVVLAILVLGTTIYLKQTQKPQSIVNQVTIPKKIVKPSSLPTTQNAETANWKTYTNNVGKYTVQYPPNYTVQVAGTTNNMPAADVNFSFNNFTQRRGQNEKIGIIYIEEEENAITNNISMVDYIKNDKWAHITSYQTVYQDTIDGQVIYRVANSTAPYEKSNITYIKLGSHVYRLLFQTGGGDGGPTNPPVYEWANYPDYEKVIASFRSL